MDCGGYRMGIRFDRLVVGLVYGILLLGFADGQTEVEPGFVGAVNTEDKPVIVELVGEKSFNAGQEMFILNLPGDAILDVTVDTCTYANYNTTILVMLDNPLEVPTPEPSRVTFNQYDPTCSSADQEVEGIGRSKVEFRTENRETILYIVVTGRGTAEGSSTLSITAKSAEPLQFSWGLDRIDQRNLPRTGKFEVEGVGDGVFAYIVDSGILTTHSEFRRSDTAGTGTRARLGATFVGTDESDCSGHGTHVAALVAGRTLGVASKAEVIAVKVLDCDDRGNKVSVIEAIDWIIQNITQNGQKSAVVVMSVLSDLSEDLNNAVQDSLFNNDIPIIAAAGNFRDGEPTSSCRSSPGSLDTVITVSASTVSDQRAPFSRSGACTNIYAPGAGISSAFHTGNFATRILDGTSQAVPLVAGAVAVLMEPNPGIPAATVNQAIVAMATKDVLSLSDDQDANALLFVRNIPTLEVESPPEGNYYIYFAFRHESPGNCTDSLSNDLRDSLQSWLDEKEAPYVAVEVFSCTLFSDPLGFQDASREVVRQESETERLNIQYEVLVKNIKAAETYDILEQGVFDKEVQERLSHDTDRPVVEVIAEPWVVDAQGLKYWAAPVLPSQPQSLTTGAIVGIVLGSLAVFIALIVLVLLIIRWTKPAETEDEILEKKQSKDAFVDTKSPKAKFKKQRAQKDPFEEPDAFIPPPNAVALNMDASSSQSLLQAISASGDVESMQGGGPVFQQSGNEAFLLSARADSFGSLRASNKSDTSETPEKDLLDGPLRTESFGDEALLIGGGPSRRNSFADADDIVEKQPSVATEEKTPDLFQPSVRMDSFGDVKLDTDLL